MSPIKTCVLVLTDNKEVYRKGMVVSGTLVLYTEEDVEVRSVRVYLYGESLASWDEFSPVSALATEEFIAKEKYFGQFLTVFGKKLAVTNKTTKDLGKLKAQLVQNVVYSAKGETKTREKVLRVLEGLPVKKGEERVWKDQLLEIDAIPPSTKPRSCHIVVVSYYVKVLVEIPLGFNLDTYMPITIGTVPYGHLPQSQGGAAAAPALDDIITYTKGSKGIHSCYHSEGNFIAFKYVPMCAYVTNYEFPPPQQPKPVPAAAATPKTKAESLAPSTPTPSAGVTAQPATIPALTPEASAMPLLPSYDDVLKMDNPAATKEVAIEPLFEPEHWPARTSVAILKFASEEAATDWFKKTTCVSDPSWFGGSCDAMVATMFEQFREANRIFSMTSNRMTDGITKEQMDKVQNLYVKTIRPLRLMKTCVRLAYGKQYTTLRGRWLSEGMSLSLSQWESLEKIFEFKQERKQAKYKEVNNMLSEMFETKTTVQFQSEDLSPFQVSHIQSEETSDSPAVEI